MKKVLSTALILGALYGTASAAPITSPIYMPEAGKILSDVRVGYTTSKFDKTLDEDASDKLRDAWNIGLDGSLGLTDRLGLNYGFNLDFMRKYEDEKQSAKFTDFYFGVTGRVVDVDVNKLDIIFNIGQSNFASAEDQVYLDLAIRYGLDLDMYNLGFSLSAKYINEYKDDASNTNTDGRFNFTVALENEFILSEEFTIGLDLFYTENTEAKGRAVYVDSNGVVSVDKFKEKSYSEYGFNLDANYAVAPNNFVGAYFGMTLSDEEWEGWAKDPLEYRFGLKYVAQF